jgi:hypothetical protein
MQGLQTLHEQLQTQLLLQSLEAAGSAFAPAAAPPGLLAGAGHGFTTGGGLDMTRAASVPDAAWINSTGLPNASSVLQKTATGGGSSIYIKGLPENADKLWLYEKFSRFGGILSVRVLVDEKSGKCNGIGFVNFTSTEAARAAHETMNGVNMGERLLHVMVQTTSASRSSRPPSVAAVNSMQSQGSGRLPSDMMPPSW